MATKRAPNFTEMEKELLVSLVVERRNILENKKKNKKKRRRRCRDIEGILWISYVHLYLFVYNK